MDPQGPVGGPRPAPPPPPSALRAEPPRTASPRSARRGIRVLAVVLASLLVVAGTGAAAAFYLARGASEELIQMIPASSDVVVTAYLDPSAGQKLNLLSLMHRFPALADDRQLRGRIDDLLDQALEDAGLSHQDVRSWLGSEVAVAIELQPGLGDPTTAILITSTDDDAAETAIEQGLRTSLGAGGSRGYRGVSLHTYGAGSSAVTFGIVDHVVVLGSRADGVTRVIDVAKGTGRAIGDDPRFSRTISTLPRDRLGFAYVNAGGIVRASLEANGLGAAIGAGTGLDTLRALEGIGVSLSAHPDGLALDYTIGVDPSKLQPEARAQLEQPSGQNGVVRLVPGDALAVMTQRGLAAGLRAAVDQALATPEGERVRQRLGVDQMLAALTGDVAVEVAPEAPATPIGGAVVLGVSDAKAVQRTLDGLARLAIRAQRRAEGAVPTPFGDLTGTVVLAKSFTPEAPTVRLRTTTYRGVRIRYVEDPSLSAMSGVLPAYAVVDGAAIIGSTPMDVRKVIDVRDGIRASIVDSPSYLDALAHVPGDGTLYVDVAGVVSGLGPQLPPDVRWNLEPLRAVVLGSTSSPSRITGRLFVRIG
ncbi:MAG TPA: DUF3352 domain-containing protein [Actinomycetota bacterium]|nr:DUF3352 domain-containing protein [Actinomycetota bacterium]